MSRRAWARWRDTLRDRPAADLTYRTAVAVMGVAVLAVGVVAIPYPGPGWAIVFLGLAILATEFEWARHALHWTRQRYDRAMDWFKARGPWLRALGFVLTAAVVVGSLWVLGALSWTSKLVGVDWPWLRSPIGLGA